MTALDKIREQFSNNGYREVDSYKLPTSLLWLPDLIFSKDDYIFLVLVKSNDSIPPSFLNRITNIPRENIIPLIVFAQKLNATEEKLIVSFGISTAYFIRGKLVNIIIRRKPPKKSVKQAVRKKLRIIDIFLSSKQKDTIEREYIKARINFLRETDYPFHPPHLIEYDKFSPKEIYKHIDKTMDDCEWVVIILEDNYSDYVRYEFHRTIRFKDPKNIFMFVKATKKCHETWKKELARVKKLETFKFLPYINIDNLEVVFMRAIKDRMREICKKEKVEMLF